MTVKLYNYDKEILKFKRIIKLENIPDNYEFCTLTEIPKYDIENEYLEYSRENDNWIIKQIEKPIIDLELLKQNKIKEIKTKTSNIIKLEYGSIENQFNIFNGLGIYKTKDKSNYKTFTNNILKQEDRFKNQVNDIQTIEELNNFKYEFIWE